MAISYASRCFREHQHVHENIAGPESSPGVARIAARAERTIRSLPCVAGEPLTAPVRPTPASAGESSQLRGVPSWQAYVLSPEGV